MKRFRSAELLDQLASDTRQVIANATFLKGEDPGVLLEQPAPGKWSVIQVIEHLNSYDRYYLLAIEKALKTETGPNEYFISGWLGNYFTRMMKPGVDGRVMNKMPSPKEHRPAVTLDAFPVINDFIEKQHYLLELIEQARQKDIGRIRVPISLSKFIRLKLGDTFRFLGAHKERHFVQIKNTIAAIKGFKDKYPASLPVA